jgi:preprotein translocase subunit YajC
MLNFFISNAYAEGTKAASQTSPLTSLAPFVLIFGVFYFLMIRPQKKKMEQEKSMLVALGKGDEIFTKSGVLGIITGITEKIVTLEIDQGVKLKVLRNQIGGLSKTLFEKKNDIKPKK